MVKTIVDANGVMRTITDSRKQELEKIFEKMENDLHDLYQANINPDQRSGVFTKTMLARNFSLSAAEVRMFLKSMDKLGILKSSIPVVTNGWCEEAWYIGNRPQPKAPSIYSQVPIKGTKKHLPGRMRGKHECGRCGTVIVGSGRHAKSLRGHTQAVCDSAMVAKLMSD